MAGYDRSLYQMYLGAVPMFSRCTPEQLDRLADLGDAIAISPGKDIVREGDEGNEFYVITSGKARVARGGRAVTTLGAGDFFGELALFDSAPRNATVSAEGEVSLVTLTSDALHQALDEMPTMRDAVIQGMARRLHELDARA
jgi:CRP/FNR family transcriptional regulator, cyclic AMP receptor protein